MSRRQILTDLLTQLGTITPANGYQTAIGANAKYWECYPDDYAGPPTVTFFDREEDTEKNNTLYNQVLNIEIQAIAYTSAANKLTDSCNLIDDLYKALVQTRWTEAAIIVRPKSNEKTIEGKGKQAIAVSYFLEIEYRQSSSS